MDRLTTRAQSKLAVITDRLVLWGVLRYFQRLRQYGPKRARENISGWGSEKVSIKQGRHESLDDVRSKPIGTVFAHTRELNYFLWMAEGRLQSQSTSKAVPTSSRCCDNRNQKR